MQCVGVLAHAREREVGVLAHNREKDVGVLVHARAHPVSCKTEATCGGVSKLSLLPVKLFSGIEANL